MVLGDGIRRNIASVDPSERAMLREAFIQLNDHNHILPGNRSDAPAPGGVTWWFKQDEIHQATHVRGGPEFIPWHREMVNRLEQMLRQINPQLSLHYWDWTQDPRAIPNANLGGGVTGTLNLFTEVNLFTESFMGYGGATDQPIGEPWLSARYYVPGASPAREDTDNPADPPRLVSRFVNGSPATSTNDNAILNEVDFAGMRQLLESVHNAMHGFVNMGGAHISFRDPFVFLLHSNVDRLFARWQTDLEHPERLKPDTVYGTESNLDVPVGSIIQNLNHQVEPWSTGHSFDEFGVEHFTRPWFAPENQGEPHTYKHLSIVLPPRYDTNYNMPDIVKILVRVETLNQPGADTGGEVFLGIGGREFNIDSRENNFERNAKELFILGDRRNRPGDWMEVRNKDRNDPRVPLPLHTNDLDKYPVYLRFEPEQYDSAEEWGLNYVFVKVNPTIDGQNQAVLYEALGPADEFLWLGRHGGRYCYLHKVKTT